MKPYRHNIGSRTYHFSDLKYLMAKASPMKSGDALAGVAAATGEERIAAKFALADLPLTIFLTAAWQTTPRDKFIGWNPDQRETNLHLIVNNAGILILPWIQSKNLAS